MAPSTANGSNSEAVEIPKTMRGVVVHEYNEEVVLHDDLPVPEPQGTELLVRVTACSLCSSDLTGIAGFAPTTLPYVLGHEPVGRIVKLGPAAPASFQVGDRVGFMPAAKTCGGCRSCLSGNRRFCRTRTNVGFGGLSGGFSQYSVADPESTVKIPDELPDHEAAPLLCAGVTAFNALKKAASLSSPGSCINVVGCGGVGHLVIQFAVKSGFDVQAFDIADDRLELAKACGATRTYRSDKGVPEGLQHATCTIVVSGAPAAYEYAFKVAGDHTKVIAIGVPTKPVTLSVMEMIYFDKELKVTMQGDREDLTACLELAARRGIKPVVEKRSIETIHQGIAEVGQGKVTGRYVYSM